MLKENIVEKGEIAHYEQFHLFPESTPCNLYLKSFKSHISAFICSFVEFRTSQNGIVGNRLSGSDQNDHSEDFVT